MFFFKAIAIPAEKYEKPTEYKFQTNLNVFYKGFIVLLKTV